MVTTKTTAIRKPANKKKGGTKCPITKKQFASAMPLKVVIGEDKRIAMPKEFSTGSLGWYMNDKLVVDIDDIPCKVQVNLSMVVIGSKEV